MALKLLSSPGNAAQKGAAAPRKGKPRLVLVDGLVKEPNKKRGAEKAKKPKEPRNTCLPISQLEIEKKVMLLRMGPMGEDGKTLEEIANIPIWKKGRVSRERARQVQESALRKLRKGRASWELRKLLPEFPE